jgi:hypothetical protein
MKTKTAVLALVLCFAGSDVCPAKDANLGAWKVNEATSRWSPGATTNHTVVYEASGGNIKVTVDGTDADGKPTHSEWSGKFDGKDYPVTGDSTSDTRAYKKIEDLSRSNCAKLNFCTLELTAKKDGVVTMRGYIVVSPDGTSRTVTVTGSDSKGNRISSTAAYDKQ